MRESFFPLYVPIPYRYGIILEHIERTAHALELYLCINHSGLNIGMTKDLADSEDVQ